MCIGKERTLWIGKKNPDDWKKRTLVTGTTHPGYCKNKVCGLEHRIQATGKRTLCTGKTNSVQWQQRTLWTGQNKNCVLETRTWKNESCVLEKTSPMYWKNEPYARYWENESCELEKRILVTGKRTLITGKTNTAYWKKEYL